MTSYRHLKIIVGLVLIFAAGAVTGSIVTHQMIKRVFEKSLKFENWTAGAVAHIDKKLHLTADQKAKIREIMEDTGKQLQSVFSKTMKESGQILVQSGKRVDQVLTPEQRAIHNEMKTQAVAKENRRALFTFDLKTGKELWQAGVTFEGKEPTNHQNPYCSASPATDGRRVVAFFGTPRPLLL